MMDRAVPPAGVTLSTLAAHTGATLEGDGATIVRRVGTLDQATPDAIAFLANPKYRHQLAATCAAAVIVAPEDAAATSLPKLVSANPYATYAKVAALLHPEAAPARRSARAASSAKTRRSASVLCCTRTWCSILAA